MTLQTDGDHARWVAEMLQRRCERQMIPAYHAASYELHPPVVLCAVFVHAEEAAPTEPLRAVPPPPVKTQTEADRARTVPSTLLDLGSVLTSGSSLPRIEAAWVLKFVSAAVLADTFDRHISVEKDWRTSQDVVVLRTNTGRVRPFIEMSYLILDPRTITTYSPDLSPARRDERRPKDEYYVTGDKSPYYFGGLSYNFGRGFSASMGGTAIFGDKTFYAAAIRLSIPLGPQP